jgi:hypothetical protein
METEKRKMKNVPSPVKRELSPIKLKHPDLLPAHPVPVPMKLEPFKIAPPPVIDFGIKFENEVDDFDDELFAFDLGEVDFDALEGEVSTKMEDRVSMIYAGCDPEADVRYVILSRTHRYQLRPKDIARLLGSGARSRQSSRDFVSVTAGCRLWILCLQTTYLINNRLQLASHSERRVTARKLGEEGAYWTDCCDQGQRHRTAVRRSLERAMG